MKRVSRILLISLSCALVGCDKLQEAFRGVAAQMPESAADKFARECEEWKVRAVKEFPDLGKAGTPMNARFLESAKELSDRNGEELKYPNWPYLLAVKVNSSLTAGAKPVPQPGARPAANAPVPGSSQIGKFYTTQELRALGTLPSAVSVLGRVTRVDEIGLPPGVLLVVLDDTLKCELTMVDHTPGESFSWQRSGSIISLVRHSSKGNVAVASLSMGQVIRVEGVFAQRSGSPVLVGTARRD
jgi:hypothetical protein